MSCNKKHCKSRQTQLPHVSSHGRWCYDILFKFTANWKQSLNHIKHRCAQCYRQSSKNFVIPCQTPAELIDWLISLTAAAATTNKQQTRCVGNAPPQQKKLVKRPHVPAREKSFGHSYWWLSVGSLQLRDTNLRITLISPIKAPPEPYVIDVSESRGNPWKYSKLAARAKGRPEHSRVYVLLSVWDKSGMRLNGAI